MTRGQGLGLNAIRFLLLLQEQQQSRVQFDQVAEIRPYVSVCEEPRINLQSTAGSPSPLPVRQRELALHLCACAKINIVAPPPGMLGQPQCFYYGTAPFHININVPPNVQNIIQQ